MYTVGQLCCHNAVRCPPLCWPKCWLSLLVAVRICTGLKAMWNYASAWCNFEVPPNRLQWLNGSFTFISNSLGEWPRARGSLEKIILIGIKRKIKVENWFKGLWKPDPLTEAPSLSKVPLFLLCYGLWHIFEGPPFSGMSDYCSSEYKLT